MKPHGVLLLGSALLACAAGGADARAKKGSAKKARLQSAAGAGGGLPGLGGPPQAAGAGDYAAIGNQATAMSAEGRHDEAIAGMRRAIALRPEVPNGHYNLGVLCTAAGRHAEALPSLRRAHELAVSRRKPDDPLVFITAVGVATAQHELGAYAEAIESFQAARKLATNVDGRLQVEEGAAGTLFHLRRYEEAAASYTAAAKIARDPRSQESTAEAVLRDAQQAIASIDLAETNALVDGNYDAPVALRALEEALGGPARTSRRPSPASSQLLDVLNSWWASDAKVIGALSSHTSRGSE